MMERIREGSTSLAVKVILGLIIFSFVFAGIGSYLVGGNQTVAAKVGDREIGVNEFERAYQIERNRMQSQFGESFTSMLGDPNYVKQLRQSVLDRMVNEAVIDNQVDELQLYVSDEQIRQTILELPEFQQDGKFSEEIYNMSLRRAGFTSDSFANYLRQNLSRNQLTDVVESTEFILPSELEQQAKLETQERKIRTITLSTDEFAKKTDITDEEIQTYYDKNKQQFTQPEQVKVSYVELSGKSLKDQAPVTEKEISDYFNENIDKYSTQEKRDVSHILIKDSEEEAEKILDRIEQGEDFATVAKEVSQDLPTAKLGGELGLIQLGVMDENFEDAAFKLATVGSHTDVVKSDFGYHIIKLNRIEKAKTKPLSEVKDEIQALLVDEHAANAFYELQTQLENVVFESSLEEAADVVNGKVMTPDFFSRSDAPEPLSNADVLDAIYSQDVKEDGYNSDIIELAPEHVLVVRVDEVKEEFVLPLDEVKSQVKTRLANQKGKKEALELAKGAVKALNEGDDAYLTKNDLVFTEPRTITRADELANDVYRLVKPISGESTYTQVSDRQGNHIIIALDDIMLSDKEKNKTDQIKSSMLRTVTQDNMNATLETVKSHTDVSYQELN